jgi:predicted DNA binding CopG/RHH family protein
MSDAVFDNLVLDEEEQWIEDHLEEFVPAPEWVGESLREAAKNPPRIHYSKQENKKHVSLRLDNDDIDKLKGLAMNQGLQYQTLIGSVLHRYVMGTLVDVSEIRKVFAK